MENVLIRIIYLIIHLLVDCVEAIFYFGLEFRDNLFNFINNLLRDRKVTSLDGDKVIIDRNLHNLNKIPQHIAVLLYLKNETDVDLSQLSDLIFWSLNSGVNFISFYDFKGVLKHQLSKNFYENIEHRLNISGNENVVWGPHYQAPVDGSIKFPHRNGYKKHIVINLYSSDDSYGTFNQLLTHELSKTSSQQITIDLVDEKLKKLYGNIPDPELALYFGNNTCTSGFLPWHMRLTEFIQIAYKLNHLSLDKYLGVLYKYAKCEQRFGK